MSSCDAAQIGARIRRQRIQLGDTREALAEKLGVTPKFCADLELGQRGMSVATLCRLSRVLHLSTDYILFGSDTPGDHADLLAMLDNCPPDKLPAAEQLLRIFLAALEP